MLLSIPLAERRINPNDKKPYIVYKIVLVEPGGASGFTWRRYQELYELSQKVEAGFPHLDLPDFPSRILFDFLSSPFDADVVEKRRNGLELYLRALVASPQVFASPIVGGFFRLLEPLSPSDLASVPPPPSAPSPSLAPPTQSRQVPTPGGPPLDLTYAHSPFSSPSHRFQLPPPPLRRVPDIILLPPNQEECFASSMMDAVKQTLLMLSNLDLELEAAPSAAAKLQTFEHRRERFEPRVRLLQEHIYLVLRIANNLHPVHHAHLVDYFAKSLESMRRALQWAQHLEESLFLLLDTAPAAAPPSEQPPQSAIKRQVSPPLLPAAAAADARPLVSDDSGFVPAPIPPSIATIAPTAAAALPTVVSEPPSAPPQPLQAPQHPQLQPFLAPVIFPPAAAASLYPAEVRAPNYAAPLPYVSAVPPPSLARENADLPARVRAYEEEGEQLLVRAVEESDAAVQPAVEALREKLQREIVACSVPGLEEFAQRCTAARSYLDDNLALVRRMRTRQGVDDVERFEAELFALLHKSSSVSPTDIAESTALRNGLLKLMREMGLYKGVLLKRLAPEAAPILRRLEDLQENVANFEAEVTLKFGWERGFADRAKEMLKSKQIAEAKKEHEAIANNIFEL